MKKIVFFCACLIGLQFCGFAQTFDWAVGFGGTEDEYIIEIAFDDYDNVYVTGYFESSLDFDPGPDTITLTASSGFNIFLAKYSNTGDFIWARNVGASMVADIKIDSSGIYLCGGLSGTGDFGADSNLITLASNGIWDIFIAKYNHTGDLIWVNVLGGTNTDKAEKMCFDEQGNIYVTGYFESSVDFDPGPDTTTLTAIFDSDAFLAKYSNTGDLINVWSVGGVGSDCGEHMIVVDDTLYWGGIFYDIVDFDLSPATYYLGNNYSYNTFFSAYSLSGNLYWAKNIQQDGICEIKDMAIDQEKNIYMTGRFSGTVDFDPGLGVEYLASTGTFDVYISKYDYSGNYLWTKSIAFAVGVPGGGQCYVGGLSLQNDFIYINGWFLGTIDFDPSVNDYNIASNGSSDVYIAKYGSNGDIVWANGFGGIDYDLGYSIKNDDSDIYLIGKFNDTVDFDPSSYIFNLVANNNTVPGPGGDMFIMKLGDSTTGLFKEDMSLNCIIYPNPASQQLVTIETSGIIINISCYNLMGQLLLESQDKVLNISNLSIGTYLVRVRTENGVFSKKLIVQ